LAAWGGPQKQWENSIYLRIKSHVLAASILEIAPGYGRWTDFLKDLCSKLIVLDLAALSAGSQIRDDRLRVK